MILFQNCAHCGATISDRKILQLLEVFPCKCPNCGEKIFPIRTDEHDIYVTITEVHDDCTIKTTPCDNEAIEMTSDGMPDGFTDTMNIGGMDDEN